MNLALLWCWKEWRAQRALLGAYSALVFTSLVAVFLMVSGEFWQTEGNRAHALGWFVGAGVVGVLAFAVPQLVSSEYASKSDTFVRRLPGALLPSFLGKLLFVTLAAIALPLLGLVVGEVFLTATGHGWDDLFPATGNACAEVWPQWPQILLFAAWATLAVPWIWVMGTWLPGGRMAVGGTVLLSLSLAMTTLAVLERYQGLMGALPWQPWAFAAVPVGFAIAGISWVRGRRGGGSERSARIGITWFAIGLLAPVAGLGSWIREYHHPDLARVASLRIVGLSPDLHFAIGHASSHAEWSGVAVRIDLVSGAAEQIAGIDTSISPELLQPCVITSPTLRRYWQLSDNLSPGRELFDLCTGEREPIGFDYRTHEVVLPATQCRRVEADELARWPFRCPGGVRAAVVGKELLLEQADGSVRREALQTEDPPRLLLPMGHGMLVCSRGEQRLHDLARHQTFSPPGLREPSGWAVRGIWLLHECAAAGQWRRFDPERGTVEPCPEVRNCEVVGLFDDERLLCTTFSGKGNRTELFLYRPGDREVTPLSLPEGLRGGRFWPFGPPVQCIRDAGSLVVVPCRGVRKQGGGVIGGLIIDPVTLAIEPRLVDADEGELHRMGLLAVPDAGTLLVCDGRRVMRLDARTGTSTVLFPRTR